MLVIDEHDMRTNNASYRSYVNWLGSLISDKYLEYSVDDYSDLLDVLWDYPFVPSFGNDLDRMEDGLELRDMYRNVLADTVGIDDSLMPDISDILGECRVLEMMISMSMCMYDMMIGTREYNTIARWFWEMVENIGFDAFDNDNFDIEIVLSVLDDVINRTDNTNTKGFFNTVDWRFVELWYQMQDFIKKTYW